MLPAGAFHHRDFSDLSGRHVKAKPKNTGPRHPLHSSLSVVGKFPVGRSPKILGGRLCRSIRKANKNQ
ncbi:MAG TPA: hypothetical protein VEX43_16195, partial [Chthoniobacterales bacterium]|nr:hypothetical protein [Chthoniobacterales bacterium]